MYWPKRYHPFYNRYCLKLQCRVTGPIEETYAWSDETALTLSEVPDGTYNICITVDGIDPTAERC